MPVPMLYLCCTVAISTHRKRRGPDRRDNKRRRGPEMQQPWRSTLWLGHGHFRDVVCKKGEGWMRNVQRKCEMERTLGIEWRISAEIELKWRVRFYAVVAIQWIILSTRM